jgi:DNA-binding Xre family transcriptional regulator
MNPIINPARQAKKALRRKLGVSGKTLRRMQKKERRRIREKALTSIKE